MIASVAFGPFGRRTCFVSCERIKHLTKVASLKARSCRLCRVFTNRMASTSVASAFREIREICVKIKYLRGKQLMRYKPSMLLLALFYNAFSLQNKEKSIRHRSGVVPSPRWRISITAVMGWRHRGDGNIVYNPFAPRKP